MLSPLGPTHAGLIAGMHRICFAEPWDAAAMAELLVMPGSCGWLDSADGQPRGFLMARRAADEAEILTLMVLPPYRRQGIAGALLTVLADHLLSLGIGGLYLEVAADNAAGRALYAAHGFHPVGRRRRYYPGGGDALVLRRDLDR